MAAPEQVVHPFEPVFDNRSRVLLLGTMPSPASRTGGFYYGHPRNRFWQVLATLFDEPTPATNERKRDFLLRNHLAVWDVLATCEIAGASDASVRAARPNDLARILDAAPIEAVFCTGAKAAELYARLCEPSCGLPATRLPSTSPANAAASFEQLLDAYRAVLPLARPFEPPVLDVAQVIALERALDAGGTPLAELMERAGIALAHHVHQLSPKGRIAVLCGSGNNGGDGWVAAAELARWGHAVELVSPKDAEHLTAQPAADAARRASATLRELGMNLLINPRERQLEATIAQADVVVDALLGTGFNGEEVREPYATWIELANTQRERGTLTVAADVCSGLSAQTGRAATPCIHADVTVTMICEKTGLLAGAGPTVSGRIRRAPLAYIEPLLAESG